MASLLQLLYVASVANEEVSSDRHSQVKSEIELKDNVDYGHLKLGCKYMGGYYAVYVDMRWHSVVFAFES